MGIRCPGCGEPISRFAVRGSFACRSCGSPLRSNYRMYQLLVVCATAAFLLAIIAALETGLIDVGGANPRVTGRWIAGVVVLVGSVLGILLMPQFVRLRIDAGAADRQAARVPLAHGVHVADAPQDRQRLLRQWQKSVDRFHRNAGIGLMIILIGGIGIPFALAIGIEHSTLAGSMAIAACGVVVFVGFLVNRYHARRALRCPQCGQYPQGDSVLAGRYPVLSTLEFQDGACVHCGFHLNID